MKSLTKKVFLNYFILIYVNLAIIKIFSGGYVNTATTEFARNSILNELSIYSSEINLYLESYKLFLDNKISRLKQDFKNLELETNSVKEWLIANEIEDDVVITYFVVDKQGKSYLLYKGNLTTPDLTDREYYKKIVNQGYKGIYVSNSLIGKTTKMPMLIIARGIEHEGKLFGLMGLSIRTTGENSLMTKTSSMGLKQDSYGWIGDSNGSFLVQPKNSDFMRFTIDDKQGKFTNLEKVSEQLKARKQGMVDDVYQNTDGEKRRYISTHMPIEGTPLSLGINLAYDNVYASAEKVRITGAIFAIVLGLTMAGVILFLLPRQFKPLLDVVKKLENLSSNEADLTNKIPELNKDHELGQIVKNFNKFMDNIHDLVSSVKQESMLLSERSELVNKSTLNMSSSLQNVNKEILNTSAAVDEMSRTMDEIAKNADEALNFAKSANLQADTGVASLAELIQAINTQAKDINDVSTNIHELQIVGEKIVEIMEIINSIAEQTNLLALNAAIEAARAGDAGRGFAVVADEVRNLASRTHERTEEIESTIDSLHAHIDKAATAMRDSNEQAENSVYSAQNATSIINNINTSIENIELVNSQIASSTYQQKRTADGINETFNEVMEYSNISNQALNSLIKSNENLEQASGSLAKLVGRFRI